MSDQREESSVDKYIGGITTPPRKRSLVQDSPKVHRTDPFGAENKNLNEEIKKKLEKSENIELNNHKEGEDDEYEVVVIEEDEESEEEIEEKETETKPPLPKKLITSPQKQDIRGRRSKLPPVPIKSRGPPPVKSRKTPPIPQKDLSSRKRDAPPLKPRKDVNTAIKIETKHEISNKENEDRSKTPQPSTNTSNTLNPGRISRFSRETDEPSITHAVVRDKSIGERIVGRFLPGFLGGNNSTVAVSKADEKELKKSEEKKKNPKNDSSTFGGLFNGLLGKLINSKKQAKQPLVFTSEEEEEVPPPPKVAKARTKKDPKDKNGKKRLANLYATTFDMTQLAPNVEGVGLPTTEEKDDFKPPPIGGGFVPESNTHKFNPHPVKTNSPKNVSKSQIHHKEPELENVRQDITNIPKFELNRSNQEIEDGNVRFDESENEEIFNNIKTVKSEEGGSEPEENITVEGVVPSETYELAYNQLQKYKMDNKSLQIKMERIRSKAEMDIDYFVQMVEDVKYRGLDEIEVYKSEINILKAEQKKFITKQAENLCTINRLETDIKITEKNKQKEKVHKSFNSPAEARQGLGKGLEELKNLKNILETVGGFQSKINQKDSQIRNILSEILRNVDENSEQGQILLQNMGGDYDIETIRTAIQQIFEENAKIMSQSSHEVEESYTAQIEKLTEDSRYKEERINELIKDGLQRAKLEDEQTKEFMAMVKDNEEKLDKILDLENEIKNLKENHKKIEEQYEARFQEILDENQNEREQWMMNGTVNAEEASSLKVELRQYKIENKEMKNEIININDSYKIMEAEFSKFDEENNAQKHTIMILEKEVSRRDEILEQYEQENNEILDENQQKVKDLIDQNLELDQKLTDTETQYSNICDYLKDIYENIKGEDREFNDEDIDKSLDGSITKMTEEEADQLYEDILKLFQSKKQEIETKVEELVLKIEEMSIELSYKESELLDLQISGSQNSGSTDDEERMKIIRTMKEKIDDLTVELRNKNNQIKQLNEDLEARISQIYTVETEKNQLEIKLEEFNDQENIDEIMNENKVLEKENNDLHTQLLALNSKLEDLQDKNEDKIFGIKSQIALKDQEISQLKEQNEAVRTQENHRKNEIAIITQQFQEQLKLHKVKDQNLENMQAQLNSEIEGKNKLIQELNEKIVQKEKDLSDEKEDLIKQLENGNIEKEGVQSKIQEFEERLKEKDIELERKGSELKEKEDLLTEINKNITENN